MNAPKLFCVLLAAAMVAACTSDPSVGPKAVSGATAGATTPGLAGAAGAGSAPAAAPVGGLVGGVIGGGLDEQDRQRAYAAEMKALEYGGPGTPVGWRGDSGAYGTVIAGPAYARPGNPQCRDYSHTIYVQGKPQNARGISCRNADGTWVSVN